MKASLLPLVLIVMIGCDLCAPRDGWARKEKGVRSEVWARGRLWHAAHWGPCCRALQLGQIHSSMWTASASESVSEAVIDDLGEASWMGEASEGASLLRGVPGPEEAVSVRGMESCVRW